MLEAFVPFEREISVIVGARPSRRDRGLRCPPRTSTATASSRHSTVPADDQPATRRGGASISRRSDRRALDYVGVLAVEFFVATGRASCWSTRSRRASTIPATGPGCLRVTDQFEQHIRAVAGWPLGDPRAHWRRGDGEPDRRRDRRACPGCARAAASGAARSTARPRPGRAARWAMSTGSAAKKPRQIARFLLSDRCGQADTLRLYTPLHGDRLGWSARGYWHALHFKH